MIDRSNRYLWMNSIWPNTSKVGGLIAIAVLFGSCSKSDLLQSSQDSVAPGSPEITYENYRNRKILIEVPAGNRNPKISLDSMFNMLPESPLIAKKFGVYANDREGLIRALDVSFKKAVSSITKDRRTIQDIKQAAILYDVDPANILAALLGEHTFNVDLIDDVQNFVGLADGWAVDWAKKFTTLPFGLGTPLRDILQKPAFDGCRIRTKYPHDADLWECYGAVWNSKFSGQVDRDVLVPLSWPSGGLRTVFFNPTLVGRTYGLGQLDPLRALMVNDRVHERSGFPLLSIDTPQGIYTAIINPKTGIHYVAANIRLAMERYANIANFDISKNPGLSATLYNLGLESAKAFEHYAKNVDQLRRNREVLYPIENYYGWYMNTREADIRSLLR